jgi:5-methyltetrahydrofolate--homocysteine methyltransferase
VMVPCQDILAKAKVEGADLIGLSGLITPSLEEMQHVAAEMQRDDYFRIKKIPLLIGGATCSRVHTAVKIAPHYEGPVVYVPDASRSVGVCADLLSDERAAQYIAELEADYERVRVLHASKKVVPLVSLAQARANKHALDWSAYEPPVPRFVGRRVFRNQDLSELAACIDWGPFFQTWDLAGRFPEILRDDVVGAEAQRVFSDGKRLLQRAIEGRWLQANGVIALLPANTVDDDTIEIYTDDSRREVALRWNPLRLQTERPVVDGPEGPVRRPNRSLADFIAPRGVKGDYIGLFAVTAGLGVEKKARQFTDDHDDYSAIMLKALADRLAEAFAERMHQRVRTEF